MQRFLAGACLAFALVGYAGWSWEHARAVRALAAAETLCLERIKLAREGYVLPTPAEPPPAQVQIRYVKVPATAAVELPPVPVGPSPDLTAPVGTPAAVAVTPDCGSLGGTCAVDVRSGMVRARATCGGADVPCTVTGGGALPSPAVSLPLPPRWSAELRAGLGSDGWAAGGTVYGRSRWGGWVQAGPGHGAGGIAYRFGPKSP
jgi:hypothetical protein